MNNIKICEAVDAYYPNVDGVVRCVQNYCRLLNKKTTCKLAVPKPKKKNKYIDNEEFEVIRCASIDAPEKQRMGIPTMDAKFIEKLKNEKFDIFHAHSPFLMGRMCISLGKKQKIPVVATLHTQYHQDFERITKNSKVLVDIAIKYIAWVYNRADAVWTVSQRSSDYLRQYGYKGEITVIRNGTDFVYPQNADSLIEKINERHGLTNQKNVYCFVGRMAWYKNIKIILDALKIAKEKKHDFKMLFVGGGFDIEEVKAYATEIGVFDNCIFTGEVYDRELLQGYYLRSDLMLFPSTFDMAPIVKEEAAAHKLACVVVKDSCSAERVIDGENGFLCEENAQSLASVVLSLTPEQMKSVGETAHKTLYRHWSDVIEEVYAEYQKVIVSYKKKLANSKYGVSLKKKRAKRITKLQKTHDTKAKKLTKKANSKKEKYKKVK